VVNQRSSRSQIRRLRRHGVQPMIIMSASDALPRTAAVVLGHYLWRYRSELYPPALAGLVEAAAWLLHARSPHAWPAVACLAAAAATGILLTGRQLALATIAERIYAAAAVMGTAGWVCAAMVIGPWSRPVQAALLIGGLLAAVPWWAHRRRRAKVRVERKLAAWPEIGQAVGLAGSQVMSAVVDVWGWKARFALARGQTIADVIARLPAIESALGTYRGAVRAYPTADDLANRFELRVLDRDPHADAIAWPGPSISSISDPVEFGPFEDAEPCRVLLLRSHALIGGVSGSGKSGGLNVLMGNLTACDDVVIWAIDLKRGMELRPWASCVARLATTGPEAEALLADAIAVLEARAEMLAAVRKRVWEPSASEPALMVVVDEYAELADATLATVSHADSIARRGRAVAVSLVAATQRPTQKAMGQGTLRSQMDVRMSFRVRERRDVDLILGQGMLAAGWQAHTLNAPGKFLISAPEHDTPRRARCYLVSDDDVAFAAAGHAPYRPTLDVVSLAAIGQRARTNPDEPRLSGVQTDADIAADVPVDDGSTPVTMLWAALSLAPPDGATVPVLMMASGMSRPWVYQRLADLVRAGQVYQTSRGRWRAVRDGFR